MGDNEKRGKSHYLPDPDGGKKIKATIYNQDIK